MMKTLGPLDFLNKFTSTFRPTLPTCLLPQVGPHLPNNPMGFRLTMALLVLSLENCRISSVSKWYGRTSGGIWVAGSTGEDHAN